MVQNNARITASDLDFDTIKGNLKTFLKGQDQFKDYNFDGASLSVLLDILAYNTHYRALYDNFIINEMFLDSASKRSNIVSRAKELGYTPRSRVASTASIKLVISNVVNGPDSLTLPRHSAFNGTTETTGYTFYSTETMYARNISGTYTFDNVTVKEGRPLTTRFDVTTSSRYILKNPGIDISTLSVKVQDNASSSSYSIFLPTTDIVGIDRDARVYWIKEIMGGQYELEFGNNVIGKALVPGNVVQVEYFSTSGAAANGCNSFRYSGPTFPGTTTVYTLIKAYNGDDIESTESIKFNAPRFYSTQNRAVTEEDYRNITFDVVPDAASVSVWSGANASPPEYGKVFICIKPKSVEAFTSSQKTDIINRLIKTKNVVSVIPVIVDPQYMKIEVRASVYYNQRATAKSSYELNAMAAQAIRDYSTTQLENFDSILRASRLSAILDNLDTSITSSICTFLIHRIVEPKYNTTAEYNINVSNPIYNDGNGNALSSTGVYIGADPKIHYFDDDGVGNIRMYYLVGPNKNYVNYFAGTIAYGTGVIKLRGINISALASEEFKLILKPESYDIVSALDQLVIIPEDLIVTESIPDTGSSVGYSFTSSRS